MKHLPLLTVVFSLAFAVFILVPPFLDQSFGPYPLMKTADVFDLFTPLLLMPLYWLLFRLDDRTTASPTANLLFVVFASFWVLGQGMHLAANSIGHLLEGVEGTNVFKLTGFYDETLSHYFWHFGVISLSGLLMYRYWRNPIAQGRAVIWPAILAGIIYGFTFFAMVIEGVTVPMGLPFAVLAAAVTLFRGRKHLGQRPVIFFFLTSYSVAVLLFAVWGIWQGGFPEFSEVGII